MRLRIVQQQFGPKDPALRQHSASQLARLRVDEPSRDAVNNGFANGAFCDLQNVIFALI
jgi:hypothetical protein